MLVVFAPSKLSRRATKLHESGHFDHIFEKWVEGTCSQCSPVPTSMFVGKLRLPFLQHFTLVLALGVLMILCPFLYKERSSRPSTKSFLIFGHISVLRFSKFSELNAVKVYKMNFIANFSYYFLLVKVSRDLKMEKY